MLVRNNVVGGTGKTKHNSHDFDRNYISYKVGSMTDENIKKNKENFGVTQIFADDTKQ